ncbi:MAG: hypothetical protein JWL71_3794 [Acidobacteria bacterium]|nr:hypothetical protein [Acidobacteriota bacterium]
MSGTYDWLTGGGEMGARMRAMDWSATALGPIADWSVTLKASIGIVLGSPMPMVMLWGGDGVMIYNDAYSVFAGGRHPRLLGSPVLEGWPEVADFNRHVMQVGLGGGTLAFRDQQLVLYRNGAAEDVSMDLSYSPIRDETGTPVGVLAIVVETTERVRAERDRALLLAREQLAHRDAELQKQHLFSLFMQAPTAIVVLRGPEFVVELANPLACAVWGRRYDEVINRPLFDALPELRAQVFNDLLDDVYRSGVPHLGTETKATFVSAETGTKKTVYLTFVYAPFRDVRGEIEGVFVIASDVTDQVLARQQVDQLHDAAEAANRAKDEFLAMLGHELRNPLAPIQTALQLMRLRGDGSAERERTVIQRQVDHLTRLVDDLLDVSRIERGKVELKRERVEIADIVAKAIETASPLLEQRRHTLEVVVPRSGLAIDGDQVRLAQVVSNLLTNAAKYTEPEGRVTIAAAADGGEIVLRVRDTGVGIVPDLLPHVFGLFVQGRQSLDRSHGGLGLGLTIVRSLVALHGGTVSVHSDGAGRGSEFVVRLPRLPERAPTMPPAHELAAEGLPRAGDGLRVLVVDDNEDAADMLIAALTLKGHETRVAHDGPGALRVCEEFRPDVALLDIGLPVMDGYELAERLQSAPGMERLRLIAVTGYGQDTDRRRSRAAGFDRHLVKPIDLETLEQALRSAPLESGPAAG